jgi:hypothetical protein
MVKANHSDMEDNLSVDLKENIDNSKISQGEQKEDTNKDAHLYDKIIRDQKNEPINTKMEASTTSQPTQQALKQTAIPTVSSDMLNINTISESKPDEKMRVPIMVDITTDTENDIRKYISNNFSDESMKNIHEMLEAEMRQLLMLACEEFGVDPPNMPVEGPEPPKVNAPNIIANRK